MNSGIRDAWVAMVSVGRKANPPSQRGGPLTDRSATSKVRWSSWLSASPPFQGEGQGGDGAIAVNECSELPASLTRPSATLSRRARGLCVCGGVPFSVPSLSRGGTGWGWDHRCERVLRAAGFPHPAFGHPLPEGEGNYRPVWPKPPEPLSVSPSSSTSMNSARSQRAKTSWAMRSPSLKVKGSAPWLIRMTPTSPR
jgi:hypothetical protein